jgi:hypothetical protein
MDMTKRNWTIAAILMVLVIVLLGVGVMLGQRLMYVGIGVQLRGVQAGWLFDRIVREREIKSLLARGCVTEAIGEISNNELADRKTLSGFVHENSIETLSLTSTSEMRTLLNELDSPPGSFTNTWPGCQKSEQDSAK